jgi:hypothetical protein
MTSVLEKEQIREALFQESAALIIVYNYDDILKRY